MCELPALVDTGSMQQAYSPALTTANCMLPAARAVLPSVCIISHNAYGAISGKGGHVGGVELQTTLLARWLARRGYAVSLLTWDEGSRAEERIEGVRVIKVCGRDAGVPVIRFFHPKWTGLAAAMRQASADVYYHNCGECVTGQAALWCAGRRRAFIFSAASDADCNPRLPELRAFHERFLYRWGLRRADCVLVQTATQQRQMGVHFGVRSVVIPMPCAGPTHPGYYARDCVKPRVVWVGRVAAVKRPDRLLELVSACPDVTFDLVGPLSQASDVQEIQARAQGLRNLTLHGAVPYNRLGRYYQQAALLCCTSDYEGFPNTFLEAWSHGLPIVSTFDPDGLIAARQLGVVVRDLLEMKAAIESLLGSPELYRRMSENARTYYLKNHTLEAVMPRFEKVFLDVSAHLRKRGAEEIEGRGSRV